MIGIIIALGLCVLEAFYMYTNNIYTSRFSIGDTENEKVGASGVRSSSVRSMQRGADMP